MLTRDAVQRRLAQLIADAMYMDESEVPANELFSSFGLESLTLAKIVAKINQEYAVAIHPRDVLKHQTLRDASEFVHHEISTHNARKEAAS
jgi:acyl carrier protein